MDFTERLHSLGWNEDRQRQLQALADGSLVPARVGVEHRGAYGLLGSEVATAHLAGRFRRETDGDGGYPAAGDWVAVQPAAGDGVIHHLLPRTTVLTRRRPWSQEAQVVAANVDLVLVVTAPGADFSPRRIERYLAAVWSSGARPVVVLNKTDLTPDLDGLQDVVAAVAPASPAWPPARRPARVCPSCGLPSHPMPPWPWSGRPASASPASSTGCSVRSGRPPGWCG